MLFGLDSAALMGYKNQLFDISISLQERGLMAESQDAYNLGERFWIEAQTPMGLSDSLLAEYNQKYSGWKNKLAISTAGTAAIPDGVLPTGYMYEGNADTYSAVDAGMTKENADLLRILAGPNSKSSAEEDLPRRPATDPASAVAVDLQATKNWFNNLFSGNEGQTMDVSGAYEVTQIPSSPVPLPPSVTTVNNAAQAAGVKTTTDGMRYPVGAAPQAVVANLTTQKANTLAVNAWGTDLANLVGVLAQGWNTVEQQKLQAQLLQTQLKGGKLALTPEQINALNKTKKAQAQSSGGNTWLWIGLAAAVLLVIGGAGFMTYRSRKETTDVEGGV